MRRLVLFLMLIAVSLGTAGQQTRDTSRYPTSIDLRRPKTATKPMMPDDVVKLTQAGVSDDLIIQQLKKQGSVALSSDDIVRLTQAKVSKRVIQTMIDPTKNYSPEQAATPPPPAPQPATPKTEPEKPANSLSTVWPLAPSAAASTASTYPGKAAAGVHPRVFVAGRGTLNVSSTSSGAAYGTWWSRGFGAFEAESGEANFDAHDETMELAKDLGKICPAVTVTVDKTKADYAVALNRESKRKRGLLRDNSQVMVIDHEGTVLMGNNTHTVSGSAKDACSAILQDWQKTHATPAAAPPPQS